VDDAEFLRAFEDATLPRAAWTHAAHVRMAFLALAQRPADDALAWIRDHIRAYNAAQGNHTGYHETVTVAFVHRVADARARTPDLDWPAFADAHPELLHPSVLLDHYAPETLKDNTARLVFVPPDRAPLPPLPTFAAAFLAALRPAAEAVGVPLDDATLARCADFAAMVRTRNETLNLTRIVAPDAMAVKHFADALSVLPFAGALPRAARVADVGTGAGFPGVPLKLARPDLNLVLIDSLAKRLAFLDEARAALELEEVVLVHARAEDAGRDLALRDTCDLVVARALAALPVLLEWCAPLVKPGGRLVAMKGPEVEAAGNAPHSLNLRLLQTRTLTLPGGDARTLLLYEKIRPTPARYPRRPAEIKASPL
jgi:16S rRNA (guanine527-N7)-methyltransferase